MPHPETAKDKGDAEANNKREMYGNGCDETGAEWWERARGHEDR